MKSHFKTKVYSETSRLSAVYTSSNYPHVRYSYVVNSVNKRLCTKTPNPDISLFIFIYNTRENSIH